MEQLWAAATQATLHILKTYRFYGLLGYGRKELIEETVLQGVRHFLEFKIGKKKYNRNYPFMNNVMSSVWSVQGNIADKLIKGMIRRYNMADITSVDFAISTQDVLPLYLSYEETLHKKKRPMEDMRPVDQARIVRELYEDYLFEHKELGLGATSKPLEFGAWLSRSGYAMSEELMWALESKPVRRSMLAERLKMMKKQEQAEAEAQLDEATRRYLTNRREYQRNYARQRRQRERAEADRKLREVLGNPPEGYQWFETKGGRIGQRRIDK